jgi:magnesium chelatase subunit D
MVILAMAERLTAAATGKITSVLDTRELILEREGFAIRARARFGVIALDEGIDPEERPPQAILDRLGLHIDLNGIAVAMTQGIGYSAQDTAAARARLAQVKPADEVLVALCETAAALGIDSGRVPLLALRVARAAAALADRIDMTEEDAALAARLVFAPRATRAPAAPDSQAAEPPQADSTHADSTQGNAAAASAAATDPESAPASEPQHTQPRPNDALNTLPDRVLAAARAALPPDLLARLRPDAVSPGPNRHSGRAGVEQSSRLRGTPAGVCAGEPRAGARLNILATLVSAAPWQRLRATNATSASHAAAAPHIQVRKEDFRLTRFKRRTQTTTIFLVDASGSAALNRLAEAKGAVELLLAQSYVRRDRVALIAFRGTDARLLLPPTHSLVRVRKELASLPGGGGTPLAAGLEAARLLADSIRRRGETPVVVVLTDGRPNIARDGGSNRSRAEADAFSAARKLRIEAVSVLLVDTAPHPRPLTAQIAVEMRASYLPLPFADAGMLVGALQHTGAAGRGMSGQQAHG